MDRVISYRPDTASNWASNNIVLSQGEGGFETDTGNVKIGDGSTAWNDLGYRQSLPFTHDLTSANITHTLPPITGAPQTESIYWTDGGTYKLTLAVTDGSTVGGETAGTWEGEGNGHILVESDGSNWQVREYKDSGVGQNHGDFTDITWEKLLNSKMIVEALYNYHGETGTSNSDRFGSTSGTTYYYKSVLSFPVTFVGSYIVIVGTYAGNQNASSNNHNSTNVEIRVYDEVEAFIQIEDEGIYISGTWK